MIEFEQTGERVDFFSFEKMFHGHQTAPNLDYFFCFKIIPLLKCCKFLISIIFSFKNNFVHKENTPTKQHCEKLQLKYKSGGMFVVFQLIYLLFVRMYPMLHALPLSITPTWIVPISPTKAYY